METEIGGVHSWLLEYIDKCKSGEILIGHELMLQLDKLLAHLDDPHVQFNLKPAHKRIQFIETRCRHFEAPFAGKPFTLMLFQKAFIEAIYSFQIYDADIGRWVRLYQDVLFLVSRKSGKTPLISAICLAEFFCGPRGLKILCSSNDYEQADLMFQAINNMREESPALVGVTRKNVKGIFFGNPLQKKTKGKFSYQNKGVIRRISAKTKGKEGRNIGVGAADEIHELTDNSSIMPIRQALSTQEQPLYFELTTEGFVDGYLTERLKEARLVLGDDLERPRWLIWLYTQDTESEVWADEKTWVKSNPGLGTIKRWSFLRGMVEEAKTSNATRAFVLAKDFNLRGTVAAQTWLAPEVIDRELTFDIEQLRGAIALGGCDLSETTDLTCSHALIMRPGSDVKHIISHYWVPENQVERSSEEIKKQYREWAASELLTICPGNEIDHSQVTAWYVSLWKNRGIRTYKICLDRWGAQYLARELEDTGFNTERVLFDRGHISAPMKHAEADLRAGLVNFNKHSVTRWCLGNTGVKVDSFGLVMPVKIEVARRIDGAAALILCYYAYGVCRSEYMQAIR
jgi:phage terminase large subunit-like protein